jgi:hypothetical protein
MKMNLTLRLSVKESLITELGAIVLIGLACTSAAHAEPTSIRCAEAYGKEPYLGQGKQFVWEMAEIVLRCTPSI